MPKQRRQSHARLQLLEQRRRWQREHHDRCRSVAGSPTFSGNTMTVNVTGVADVQRIGVTLSGVTDSFAQVLPDVTAT
jgi:hypothetical protein